MATTDPTKVLALFAEQEPDLVLLDLHMPVLDGVAVLERLAEVAAPQSYLPVLVLTGDSSQQARRRALSKGAKDFVTKPFEVDEVLLRIRNLLETKYLHREIATENVVLEQRVRERTADLESAHLDTLERLAVAAEFRDDDTGRHTERVAAISAHLARAAGLDGRAGRAGAPGGAAARPRQDRDSRCDPPEAGTAHAGGVGDHEDPHHGRCPDPGRWKIADHPAGRGDRAVAPRAVGRQRLSRGPRAGTAIPLSPPASWPSPTCSTR